jgi:hypothetical protein
MATIREQILSSWHSGVTAAVEVAWPPGAVNQIAVDQLEPTATPRAWNSVFAIVGERAVPRKREGCVAMNATPLTGVTAINGQFAYRFRDPDNGDVTQYHLLASENGRLDWSNEGGVTAEIDDEAFTVGAQAPTFATLNNHCFVANGLENFKLYGTEKQIFGIERPEIGSATANAGAVGNFEGTYEVAFTFGNSVSGHESSRSDATAEVEANNTKIDLTNIPQSDDPQVDQIFVYVRNVDRQIYFYRVATLDHGTLTATIDLDTPDINLTIIGPDIEENNPPPATIKYVVAHKNRIFAADDGHLYWSKTDSPESFDPDAFDFVNKNDGQKITGLASIPGGYLVIFKEDSYYVLEGDTPGVWAISKLGPSVGCIAHKSIVLGADALYWWSDLGPVKLTFGNLSTPELIGYNRISAVISKKNLNYSQRSKICAEFQITGQRILFAIPDVAQLRNTRIVVWSSRMGCWESDRWDPIDVASMAAVNDSVSEQYVMLGGYHGQFFKLGLGGADGVTTGTTTGEFAATSVSQTVITVADAEFATTGGGLVGRKITILDDDALISTLGVRPTIVSNTATVLTLSHAVSGLVVGVTYRVIVGGPDWQFDTAWIDAGESFVKKTLEQVYVLALLYGQSLYVDMLRNRRGLTLQDERFATIDSTAAQWGAFNWNDGTLWNDSDVTYDRIRGARTGVTFALRFRNPFPSQPMILLKTGFKMVVGDDKLG